MYKGVDLYKVPAWKKLKETEAKQKNKTIKEEDEECYKSQRREQ